MLSSMGIYHSGSLFSCSGCQLGLKVERISLLASLGTCMGSTGQLGDMMSICNCVCISATKNIMSGVESFAITSSLCHSCHCIGDGTSCLSLASMTATFSIK